MDNEFNCPDCNSETGPCNMLNNLSRSNYDETTGFLSVAGHCQDCGYSFTRTFKLTLIETIDRN